MTFEEFRESVAQQLGIDDLSLDASATLREDWDLDSFDLIMLLVWIEAGFDHILARVPPPVLRTMQDAFDYHLALTAAETYA